MLDEKDTEKELNSVESAQENITEHAPEQSPETVPQKPKRDKPQVYLVYSESEPKKKTVIAALLKLGFEPILTHDVKNANKSLNELALENPEAQLAVILLNDDYFFYPKDGKPINAKTCANAKIIFEIGFWEGKLGRNQLIVLYHDQKSFRLPTEFHELYYIAFDKKGAWKTELIKRLKTLDIPILDKEI